MRTRICWAIGLVCGTALSACSCPAALPATANTITCAPTDPASCVQPFLTRTRRKMIGRWHGTVQPPGEPSREVDIIFDADGRYESRGPSRKSPALVWGKDGTSAYHRWELQGVAIDGSVSGAIQLAADEPMMSIAELRNIRMGDSGIVLSFDIVLGAGNRFHVELRRVTGLPDAPQQKLQTAAPGPAR
ncbi:MAG: hypothetical protein HY898_14325 [Deltaproteobacteria bacterium]|nr:hypothetical protein [Deltaproteobacteria bacterium]